MNQSAVAEQLDLSRGHDLAPDQTGTRREDRADYASMPPGIYAISKMHYLTKYGLKVIIADCESPENEQNIERALVCCRLLRAKVR
jgi:hypothetical protein